MHHLFAFFVIGFSTVFSHAEVLPLQLDVTTNKYIFPSQEFDMTLTVRDANKDVVKDFSLNHEKMNHTIIVSKDLETFAHIHPEQQKAGEFLVTVNSQKALEQDNIDAAQAVTKPGTFFVFSEVVPVFNNQVTLLRGSLSAHGKETPIPLKPDTVTKNKSLKYFKATGEVGQKGDAYRVTLALHKMTDMLHITFKIEQWMEHGGVGHYMTVTDLENWLGMPGHGILIGEAGDDVQSRYFHHLHAMVDDGTNSGGHHHSGGSMHDQHPVAGTVSGEELQMMLEGKDVPPTGTYKLWGQFKHNGKVHTFPFVLSL